MGSFLMGTEFLLCKMKSSGDGLNTFKNVNVLNTSGPYT